MNPHYGDYYSDENGETPPADYLDPTPIKFLTVSKGTKFTFRALVPQDSNLFEPVKIAFENAIKDEGVGAKTAVGYGRFEIQRRADSKDAQIVDEFIEPNEKSPLNRMLDALNLINATETGRISGEIINNMEKNLTTNEEKIIIAKAIQEKISTNSFKKLNKKKNDYLFKLIKQLDKP
jgi:CRISPR-associated protein Cmr6